jgi:hypothetical protein
MSVLKIMVEVTEREAGQLMTLLVAGDVPEKPGFNMTEREQSRLGEKFRRAVWDLYNQRRMRGLPTHLDETGVLEPAKE